MHKDNIIHHKMSIIKHVNAFKKCLLIYSSILILCFGGCFYYSGWIFDLMVLVANLRDYSNVSVVYSGITEGFSLVVSIAFYSGLLLSLPFAAVLLLRFLWSGLLCSEKKFLLFISLFGLILFYAGFYFAFKYLIPFIIHFFANFTVSEVPIKYLINISDVLMLLFKMSIIFGVCAEVPVILCILVKMGVLSIKKIKSLRKFFIIFTFIFAAIVTPPDVISQCVLACIMIVLFELGLLLSKFV